MSERRIRRAEWSRSSLAFGKDSVWIAWFGQVGVSGIDVAVPGWVDVDDANHTIRYWANLRNENGTLIWRGDSIAHGVQVLHPDKPISPFPDLEREHDQDESPAEADEETETDQR